MLSKTFVDLRRGMNLSHVWLYQAYHEISAKYKRTTLGSLWIVGQMVFTSLSFAIVFGALFGENLREALPYMMAGILCYTLIGYVFMDAPEVYLGNSGIISNHAYPFTYYNLESVTKAFMIFLHNVVIYEIVIICVGAGAIPHWSLILGFPVVILNLFTWGSLIGMMASRYRDLRFLLPYMSQLVMFITPVIYKPNQIKGIKRLIIDLNPIYPLVEMLRAPLMGSAMPMRYWPMGLGVTLVGVVLWLVFFSLFRKRIAFWI